MGTNSASAEPVEPIRWWGRLRRTRTRLRAAAGMPAATTGRARNLSSDPFESFDSFAATEWAATEWPDTCIEVNNG